MRIRVIGMLAVKEDRRLLLGSLLSSPGHYQPHPKSFSYPPCPHLDTKYYNHAEEAFSPNKTSLQIFSAS